MKYNIIIFFLLIFFMPFSLISTAKAQTPEENTLCAAEDAACLLNSLEQTTAEIEEAHWRDSTYRELAKIYVHQKKTGQALAIIQKINSPDTQALTIRGIGMEAAELGGWTAEEYDALFAALMKEAAKIEHPPSYAIALTYIAMGQAQAGDNDGAMKTAAMMQNDALRNKAYAESAEIQAEKGDLDAVQASLAAMDDPAFQDKAYRTVSNIFAKTKKYDMALATADKIVTPYHKAQAYLYILIQQTTPEEVSIE